MSASPPDNFTGFRSRIRQAIKAAGGAASVAEATGFAVSSVYNYRNCKPNPPIEFIWALASLLDGEGGAPNSLTWIVTGLLPTGFTKPEFRVRLAGWKLK